MPSWAVWTLVGFGVYGLLVYGFVRVWSRLPRLTSLEDEQRMLDEWRARR